MLRSLLRDEHNQFLVVEDISAISDILQHKERLLWLDLEKPSLLEFRLIQEEFELHPLAIEDAMAAHPRPKVDQYENFYLVVFYLVSSEAALAAAMEQGGNGVAPARGSSTYGVMGPGSHGAEDFRRLAQAARTGVESARNGGNGGNGAGEVKGGNGGYDGNAGSVGGASSAGTHAMRPFQMSTEGLKADQAAGLHLLPLVPDDVGAATPTLSESIVLRELTMFMGENYLITVHDDPAPEFAEVARRWRQNVGIIRPGEAQDRMPPVAGCRHLNAAEKANLDVKVGMAPDVPGEAHTLQPRVDNPFGKVGTIGPDAEEFEPPSGDGTLKNANRSGEAYSQQKSSAPVRTHKQAGEIGILLYSMLDTVVDNYFPVVDSIVDRVEDLEEQIFERYNQGAIEQIFGLKKDLLALRKVLAPERDVLNVLVRRDLPIFDQQTLLYFQDLYDHVVRITDSIDTYRDLLSSALDSFLSMQSNRLNITVQTLTSVSIILMSVAAVTGWYGMNFENMPELHNAYSYPAVIVFVAIVVVVEWIFFKRKRWL